MGGLAFQRTSQLGGLFYSATNFDPFENLGIWQPALASVNYNSVAITKQIQYFANYTTGNIAYTYAFAGSGATTALYSIKSTDGVITDESAQITTTASARGMAVWSDTASATRSLVYATDTTLRANAIPVASASDIEILTGLNSAEHVMCKGADGNLYVTNKNLLARVTSTTGTSGNSANVFAFDQNLIIRDIANDGRYLVIIADDNAGSGLGTYNCMIAFWDYTSGSLTQRYDFKANGIISVKIMDGNAYVFSRSGLHVCNVSSFPRMVFPLSGNSSLTGIYPPSSRAVAMRGADVILWASGAQVYGYGSLGVGDKKIMFNPVTGSGTIVSLATQEKTSSIMNVLMGNSTPALHIQGISSTKSTSAITTSTFTLPQPYKLDYIKIIARDKLASGESISVQINSIDGSGLPSNQQTFSYATHGAKQSKIFYPFEAQQQVFHEFYLVLESVKCDIQSIEIWGSPVSNQDQSL